MSEKETPLSVAAQAGKNLLEFCMSEKIDNPKIEMTLNVTSGERYVLKFERVDLDRKDPPKSIKQLIDDWIKRADICSYHHWGNPEPTYDLSKKSIEKIVKYVIDKRKG